MNCQMHTVTSLIKHEEVKMSQLQRGFPQGGFVAQLSFMRFSDQTQTSSGLVPKASFTHEISNVAHFFCG